MGDWSAVELVDQSPTSAGFSGLTLSIMQTLEECPGTDSYARPSLET